MPLSNELLGTESDGSKSNDYCKFCYHDGRFTHPDYSLKQMIGHMQTLMDKEKLPEEIIESAITRLPHLKRWNKAGIPKKLNPES